MERIELALTLSSSASLDCAPPLPCLPACCPSVCLPILGGMGVCGTGVGMQGVSTQTHTHSCGTYTQSGPRRLQVTGRWMGVGRGV